jgi:hypothetical protein
LHKSQICAALVESALTQANRATHLDSGRLDPIGSLLDVLELHTPRLSRLVHQDSADDVTARNKQKPLYL